MPAEVLEFPIRGSNDDYSSLQSKLVIYQRLNREWAEHLDPYEFRVLTAIVDRTIGWGKPEARFSAGRLLEGDTVCGPLNMGRASLYRALARLEEKGFISRRHPVDLPEVTFYSVHPDRSPKMALNLPKRLKEGATRCKADPVSHRDTPVSEGDWGVSHGDPIYSNPLTGSRSTDNHCAALADREPSNPVAVIRQTITRTVASHDAARAAKRETRIQRNTAEGIEAAWREALHETFPDAVEPVWTGREKGQAKRLAKGWAHGKQIAFIDFTDWAVRNWTQIMRKQFKWMTKAPPPAVPAFSFYVAMIDQFAECWGEGKLEEWASAKERTEVERLMARGMTFEQATAEFAKQHAMGELRDEMRDREIKVRARTRIADQKLKQAEQLAEFGGSAPVHPQSEAAKEITAKARKRPALDPVEPSEEITPLAAFLVPERNPFDE